VATLNRDRDEHDYWRGRRLSRRALLRGGGRAAVGLAGAALIGCDVEPRSTVRFQRPQPTPTSILPGSDAVAPQPPRGFGGPLPTRAAEFDPSASAKRGGTLRARYLEPPHFDINRTLSCATYHPLSYTQSKLTRARLGATADPFGIEIEPDLAWFWEANDGATQFTFHLRPGVMTHEVEPTLGREFTSEDARLSLERYRAGGTQRDVFATVDDIATPDDYTLVVSLSEPVVDFAASVGSWSYLWPRELIDQPERMDAGAAGTGPFVLETWQPGERATFRRNPAYFEDGQPYVDEVIAEVHDGQSALDRFVRGELHDIDIESDAEMEALLAAAGPGVSGFKFPRSRGSNVNGWHFQMANPQFQDERVRRAISLAFDRSAYDIARNGGDNARDGAAPFSNAPLPWPFLFDQPPDGSANGTWYRHDPALASSLMRAAGYSADAPLRFELESYYVTGSFPEQVIPGINASVPEVRISYRQLQQREYIDVLSERTFESAVGFVWGPPGYAVDQWITPWWHSRGTLNYNSVVDVDLDRWLEQQRGETDPLARREILQQIWDRVHDAVYDVWWPEAHVRGAQRDELMNMRWHGLAGSYRCFASDQARAVWLDDAAPAFDE